MAHSIYMSLTGNKQDLISQGCSSIESIGNRCQLSHADQIQLLSFKHHILCDKNVNHLPVTLIKAIDKATPLLGVAISNQEELTLVIDFYRTASHGRQEKYFTIKINRAVIVEMFIDYPHSVTQSEVQPEEVISLRYNDITWEHHAAGTCGYSFWEDRV